jgi:alkylation response protein AidB-like acyl-CoA dehydrogenase
VSAEPTSGLPTVAATGVSPDDGLAEFRARARAFIAERAPKFPVRAGVRAPEDVAQQEQLRAWMADLYGGGWIGLDWPVEDGGAGVVDAPRELVFSEELALANAPVPIGGSVLAATSLIEFGTPEQRAAHLPAIRNGTEVVCQLFSEPDAGSDLASLRTRAELDGAHYVVNGQKVWTTNGHWADFGYLLARTDVDVPKHKGISAFLVDMRTPGITVRPLREMTGTADFNEVFFDDVRIPVDHLIGAPGQGWAIANSSLAHERTGVGANLVTLRETWRDLWKRARSLAPLDGTGSPPAVSGETRQRLVQLYASIEALAALARTSTERDAEHASRPFDAPMAKLLFSEINYDLAEAGLKLLGPAGIFVEGDPATVDDGRWQDNFLYARAYTIAGGSSEIMRNLIAERGLGLPR